MIRLSSLSKALLLSACLVSGQLWAQSEPIENTTTTIQRNASSGNLLTGSVSKNIYKNVTVQEPYTIQVPYQATEEYTVDIPYQAQETYTIDVPYQTTETYTDYETRYRNEYRCHNVTRTRYECRNVTRYRQQCHNEVQCRTIPGQQHCRDVQECGTNALGQPICKTRRVCEGGGSQQVCENRQVCRQEPYTDRECGNVPYTEQECRNEQVSYQEPVTRTRTVTKYRQETRTRTVTRYRQETRTRTVTKYREETKCCKAVNKTVFDRQLSFQVEVNFPADAILNPSQSESLNIVLVSADARSARVELAQVQSVHRYFIARQQTTGAVIRVDLAIQPKDILSEGDLAVLSDNTKLLITPDPLPYDKGTLNIVDMAPAFRDVVSTYTITLSSFKQDGSVLVGETRTFTRDELKATGGTIKLMDVYVKDGTKGLNTLWTGNKVKFQVIAKRGGPSPVLSGKNVQAVQEGVMIIK